MKWTKSLFFLQPKMLSDKYLQHGTHLAMTASGDGTSVFPIAVMAT
jgi:hypothetical protein